MTHSSYIYIYQMEEVINPVAMWTDPGALLLTVTPPL